MRNSSCNLLVATFALFTIPACIQAQLRPLQPDQLGQRIYAIVPMIGTGQANDPIRPKHVPYAPEIPQGEQRAQVTETSTFSEEEEVRRDKEKRERYLSAILSFSYVLTDDGKRAIVEFVAADEKAFQAILRDPEVRVFRKKDLRSVKASRDEAEAEFKREKKNFDWDQLRTPGN